jgi:hypothetical protein
VRDLGQVGRPLLAAANCTLAGYENTLSLLQRDA